VHYEINIEEKENEMAKKKRLYFSFCKYDNEEIVDSLKKKFPFFLSFSKNVFKRKAH
jgi:hypothetical protein